MIDRSVDTSAKLGAAPLPSEVMQRILSIPGNKVRRYPGLLIRGLSVL